MAGRLWSVDRFGSAVRVVWHFRWRRSIGRPRNPSGSTGGYRSGTPRPGNRQTTDTGRPETGKRRWTIRWRIQPIANGCIRWNDSILFLRMRKWGVNRFNLKSIELLFTVQNAASFFFDRIEDICTAAGLLDASVRIEIDVTRRLHQSQS